MTDLLLHRGPDGAGMLVDPPAVLGHRRLAIIDLTAGGHQPMASDDGSLWIVFNGEIYNYLELRGRAAEPRPPLPQRLATPRCCCTPTPSGASDACPG